MKFELCAECDSRLIANELIDAYRTLEAHPDNTFSLDKEENDKEVRKILKAFKRVIRYSGGDV